MFEKLSKLAPREKVLLLAAGLAVFVLVVERTVVNAVRKQLKQLNTEITAREELLRLHKWYLTSGRDIEPEYIQAEQQLQSVRDANEAMEAFNGQVDEINLKCKMTCSSIENRSPVRSGPFDRYMLSIGKFETDREGLLSFVYHIQAAPGMLRIKELAVKPSKDDKQLQGAVVVTKVMLVPSSAESKEGAG